MRSPIPCRTPASCPNPDCDNHGESVASLGRAGYRKRGATADGRGRLYECKECGRRFTSSKPVRLHDRNRRLAVDLFGRIDNKAPGRGAIRGARLKSNDSYYSILRFIHSRCRTFSGGIDRALADGRLQLPGSLAMQTDAQEYTLNWTSRFDRCNVVLSCYCTVESRSGFILGAHVNFDERADAFETNRDAVRHGDITTPGPFRRHARFWLTGDDLHAGRRVGRRIRKHHRVALLEQIERLYEAAEGREDVEHAELDAHDADCRRIPTLGMGMQTHLPYTTYAHWMLLRRILSGAGVRWVQANMDECSMSRAAFLSAFAHEVADGDAHGFYVRYTKFQTIDERKAILQEAAAWRESFRLLLPPDVRDDDYACARLMMLDRIGAARTMGRWQDKWVEHPQPSINEPHKAMCWLTPDEGMDDDRKADLHLRAGLGRIDNVFMKSRRLFSALERPTGTSSGNHRVWNGYAPYNPAMVGIYLTAFRAAHNFIHVGEDGRTPAMRLGFTDEPLCYEDVLWPGERVPRPSEAWPQTDQACAPPTD